MARKTPKKTKVNYLLFVLAFVLAISQIILISAATESDFEEILQPLQTVYDLVKYAATVISGIVMLFSGITYIMSGSDPGKREKAKNMVMYVIIGLIVIWAAPFIVDLILN